MKITVRLVINDPDVEDILVRLGPYRRAVFIREAISHFSKSEKAAKLYNRLIKSQKRQSGELNLDELL